MTLPETPWLPDHADEPGFDPLDHAGIDLDTDTPMAVTPRGGAREVGRSCYQVDTKWGTYLVDCGLNQGTGGKFPDFRGLGPGDVDAVFLTHAHIDHCGGLPVLENRGLLADDAPILCTPPTAQLAQLLLEDSLTIHRRESNRLGTQQQFSEADVNAVYDRFEPLDYTSEAIRVAAYAPVPDHEPLTFEMGNAAHLLGSAWVALQTAGYRTVFSGDIGNRATHLPDLDPAPEADLLILESTYGGLHSHESVKSARTDLYQAVERALKNREPVLIPTFAVGRAQTLALLFTERLKQLPDHIQSEVRLVLDGMAQQATDRYHVHVTDPTYVDESIVNRVTESGWTQPFLPDGTVLPESDRDRERILDEFDPETGENIPLILAPSGMLTGGHSQRYFAEFVARYDSANVFLTGYQANGTAGRTLYNALNGGAERVTVEMDTNPFGTDWPESEDVLWWTDKETGDRLTRVKVPTAWLSTVDGLSGHASRHGLRQFARDVGPKTVALVHGPEFAQQELAQHLAKNVTSVEQVTRARLLTPIPVTRDVELATASVAPEQYDSEQDTISDQLEHLHELVGALGEEVADARTGTSWTETELRAMMREEIQNVLADVGVDVDDAELSADD